MNQKKIFVKGIDSDTANELLQPGVDRYRLNVRALSSNNSTIGEIETVNGNTLVSFSLPSGNNTVIGSFEDLLRNKLYYFVHNSNFHHTILEYNTVSNTIAKVFEDSVNILNSETNILNFQLTNLITGINIVELDSENHLLYWTDGYINPLDANDYNEPKKINIEKGKYFMAGNHVLGYKTPFDPEILYRIKKPDDCGPDYAWSGINTPLFNFSADSVTTLSFSSVLVWQTIPYDQDILDPNNEFDTSTYVWTVPVTGNYNLTATFDAGSPAADYLLNVAFFVNVGTAIIPGSSLSTTFGTQSYSLTNTNVPLLAGDLVEVKIQIASVIGGSGNVNVLGTLFTASRLVVDEAPNYLFKRMFVFKTQFVYDDNDVSSWSAWSPYYYPTVVHDSITGNDIVNQDDTITISVPTGNSIVKKIKVAAKQLGEITVNSLLQEIEFSIIAEIDKKQFLLGDNTFYSLIFLNNGNYLTLNIKESIKLFDSVPLASKSQEIVSNGRIVDGLITEGQDPVNVDVIMDLSYIDVSTLPGYFTKLAPASFLKSGGIYKYGIVYYDHANRSGLSNIQNGSFDTLLLNGNYGTTLYVPFLTESDYNAPHGVPNMDMSYVPQVNMNIYNEPPSWATHYQIVRSQNESIQKYFQFAAQEIQYVDETGTVVPAATATDLYVYINNITGRYLIENPTSTLVYSFLKGDRIRFIADVTGVGPAYNQINPFFDYNDSEIVSYDPSNGIVHIKMNASVPQTMSSGTLFEIYTPAQAVINDNEFMFEIGECYELEKDIHGNLIHTFSSTNQLIVQSTSNIYTAPNIVAQVAIGHGLQLSDNVKIVGNGWSIYGFISVVNPTNVTIDTTGFTMFGVHTNGASTVYKAATGILKSGDCYRVFQNMPWVVATVTYRLYMYVENMNMSNLWTSNAWDYARVNKVDNDYKRITRPTTIYYSDKFVPETFINGLSTVYDTNFETYQSSYGGIYKLYSDKQSLYTFQELRVCQILVNQIIYNDLQLNNSVGASEQVLSPQAVYYDGIFGIGKHPESFAVYGNAKYFIDVRRGALVRLSTDGLTPISSLFGMNNYFTDKCQEVLSVNQKVNINGVWDTKFNEYIVSFKTIPDVFVGETVAWNEKYNQFSTFYSFIPENMCTNGTGIVSFKNGSLYTHNTNALQANFYNTQYYPEIWIVLNEQPSIVKVLEAVGEETDSPWPVYAITTPSNQLSDIDITDFRQMEDNQYAAVLRDKLTPNVVNPLFQGDAMRGRTALYKLRFPLSTYNKLFAVNLKYIISNPFMK